MSPNEQNGIILPAEQAPEVNKGPNNGTMSPVSFLAECHRRGIYLASTVQTLPRSLTSLRRVVWNEDCPFQANVVQFGSALAQAGDLYRNPKPASGLILAPEAANVDPRAISCAKDFNPVIADRIVIRVVKNGKTRGYELPSRHLEMMLRSEVFLQAFRPLDQVVQTPLYLPGFKLMRPGYNDGGIGQRILYRGPEAPVERSLVAIPRFLDVMAFASIADRTAAVGAALLVMSRNFWPGGKPLFAVTSTKSHGGKDTVIAFAAGSTPKVSVDYQSADWAFRKEFLKTLEFCPDTGLVNVENARLGRGDRQIASAMLERFLTDPEPCLAAATGGKAVKINNTIIIATSTNYGVLSEDLLNRSLPCHLAPVGNVADRNPVIGNPKLEFLPANQERIEAELRGMIEAWKEAGCPLATAVRHPFKPCMQTIGGILEVNGFKDFLANYSLRRTTDDPIRKSLGLLGLAFPDEWLALEDWVRNVVHEGLLKTLVPVCDRDADSARERALRELLNTHMDETFEVETDEGKKTLKLEKKRTSFDGEQPSTQYRFRVVHAEPLAVEEEPLSQS